MSTGTPDKLSILLLGSPRILLNGQPLTFRSAKAVALLGYLSVSGRLHDRSELALLLWPDSDSRRARGALRYTLSLLKSALGDQFLVIDYHHIGLNPAADWEGDVVWFQRLLTPALKPDGDLTGDTIAGLEQGIALYQGDFLHSFSLRDSDNFNEWAIEQAEALQRLLAAALKRVTAHHYEGQNWDAALAYGHRWLNLDPLYEVAHCRLMQIYAAAGQWTAVHNQYQSLVDLLERELGASPQPETETLYQTLCRQREATKAAEAMPPTGLTREQRSQQVLIEKVRRFWVNGLLAPLRTEATLIPLQLHFTTAYIDHAWADVIDAPPEQAVTGIRQAFLKADHALLILGAAGAGKTMSLVELAETLLEAATAHDRQPIPIILNLSTWADRGMSIAEWAVEEMVVQYQIPRRMGRAWLDEDKLLLLLDGLDEMSPACCRDCIAAINTFRQTHGLADLAVCCRQEAYEGATHTPDPQLQLNGAVLIQPLTKAQIYNHVSPALADAILRDEALLEMAHSPLTLSLMRLAFSEQAKEKQATSVSFTRHQLFAQYIRRMVGRQQEKGGTLYSEAQLLTHLTWLAQQMQHHNQSIFLVEQLQPSWLSSDRLQWLYLFLTRSILAALLGTPIGWSFIQLIRINPPVVEVHFLQRVAALIGLTSEPWNGLFSVFVLVLITGSAAAIVDGLFFTWRRRRGDEAHLNRRLGWLQLLAVTGTVWGSATLLLSLTDDWLLACSLGAMEAVCFALAFGYLSYGQSFRTEIRSRGALEWTWGKAAMLGLLGIGLALLWSGLAWLQDPDSPRWQVNLLNTGFTFFLLGGVTGKRVEARSRPNEGMWIAGQNGLKVTGLLCLATTLLAAITVNPLSGLFSGLLFGMMAGTMHGINDVVKHLAIRLLLWVEQRVPAHYVSLLDYGASCVLLRKVGGGYVFQHRLLQAYFASLTSPE